MQQGFTNNDRGAGAQARILVVDDELGIREGCRKILEAEGFAVKVAEDGLQGYDFAIKRNEPFDLALVDLKMPGMDGVELLGKIREHDPEIVTIVITAYATLETAIETTRRGAYGYIPKPFAPDELLLLVRQGLEKRLLSLQAKRLKEERERSLLEVCGERNKSRAIINCMTDGLIVVNSEGQFALANPSAMAMLKMARMPAAGTPLAECLANGPLLESVGGVLSDREQRYEIISREIELAGGKVVMANIAPIRDEGGSALGAVVLLSDITRLKQLEKAKATFISAVAHEVKAPLAAIENFITLVLDGTFEGEKVREVLGRALARAEGARTTIADLLNLSSMEAGVIGKNKSRVLISDALEDAVASQRSYAAERKIAIDTSLVDAGASILADRDDVVKLLTNLVSNAVKYNKDGGKVTVACSAENGNVSIKVADTGIGIAKKHLPHLFDEFYRIRDENTKRIGGTGLGLSIVKKIVDAYHGEISIESEEGKGSTFTVVLRGGVQ